QLIADDGQLRTRSNITVVVNSDLALMPDLLYWPLDDGSGNIALDASGKGHNGTLVATNDWVTNGQVAGAVALAGTNDFVGTTNGSFLNGLKALSLALWIKSPTTNSDLGFISADDSGGTNETFSLRAKTVDERSHGTNVIEAIIPSRKGATRYVSASYTTTND